jgi:hypothetical protein
MDKIKNNYPHHEHMSDYDKLEWIHFAIQEAQNDNLGELETAIELVEELREPFLTKDE